MKVQNVCHEYSDDYASLRNWKALNEGVDIGKLKKMKDIETENVCLEQVFTNLSLTYSST